METPSNTQELNQPKQNNFTAQNETKLPHEINDLFELLEMAKRVDRALGEGKKSDYRPWENDF